MATTKLLWGFVLCTFFSFVTSQDCAVQNLQLTEEEPNLVATWTTTGSAADCEFEIIVTGNADSQNGVFWTTDTSFAISNAVACSEVTIEVAAGGTSVSASTTISMRATTAPYLRDMITSCNSIQMIWEAEPYEQNMCQVTHFQMFCLSDTHNFTIPQMVSDVKHRTFDILITVLQPDIYYVCNGFIFTTLAGFSPPSANIEFWSNLDSVRDLKVYQTAETLRATWEAPLNSEECGVAYEVTYEHEILGSTTVEVIGLYHEFDIEVIPCTDYMITVKPISFTGSRGRAVDEGINPSPTRVGTVENLVVEDNSENLVLSWSEAFVGQCPLVYIVSFAVNGNERHSLTTISTSAAFDRIPCADSLFSVQIESEGVPGDVVRETVQLDAMAINNITAVANLGLNGNVLSWGVPSTVTYCDISYIVQTRNYFGESQTISRDTSISLNLVPCSNNIFTVMGTANGVIGNMAVTEGVAPAAELAPPSHISTRPTFTTATIGLQGQNAAENSCVINTATLDCSNDNGDSFARQVSVDDNTPRLFSVVLDNLEQDTIYTCDARLENSAAGNEFRFRTVPLVEKDLIISDISEEGFLVSWIEEYGSDFVVGYELTVESLGPAHSLPDGCEVNTEVFTYSISNDEASSYFVKGLPDYTYKVNLTTHYTLGVSLVSNTATARTLAGEPGYPENVIVTYNVESLDAYDVSAVLSWTAPCSLNGALRGFGVNVTAHFMLGGLPQSVTVNLGLDAGEESVNNVFSKTITDINPFFTYELGVNVAAAVEGPTVSLLFEPPSACVCGANGVPDL